MIKIGHHIVIESFRHPNDMKENRTNPAKINF